ncbi:hypothetical protein BC938DRAFT_481698 [Jimgerdemannia flammicorona]|uniref:Uncharacterized protein n=1 Tax=Jimgerdemannia flammicorona TaxID=994334 RepID=A0A433QWP8_9FUNG|nr:hypothetical protein BC938DRAFT_481698 [Jimgerdemannia flammicorona]
MLMITRKYKINISIGLKRTGFRNSKSTMIKQISFIGIYLYYILSSSFYYFYFLSQIGVRHHNDLCLSIVLYANADGLYKLDLLIIGKYI